MNNAYRILEQRFEQKNILEHIVALIDLDGQLNAPSAAADGRGEQKTALELRIHEILTLPIGGSCLINWIMPTIWTNGGAPMCAKPRKKSRRLRFCPQN